MVTVLAGLTGNEWTTHESRGAPGTPYPHGGLWSVLANLTVGLGGSLVLGWCIWDRVERRAKQPVSMSRIVLIAHDRLVKVGFSIHNQGRVSVRLVGVTGGTPGIRVVRVSANWWSPASAARPLRNAVLHSGDEQPLTLLLALKRCRSSSPRLDTLDRVTAHYRLFGRTFSQPIALAIRPTVSC